jgi:hypothetical protein
VGSAALGVVPLLPLLELCPHHLGGLYGSAGSSFDVLAN